MSDSQSVGRALWPPARGAPSNPRGSSASPRRRCPRGRGARAPCVRPGRPQRSRCCPAKTRWRPHRSRSRPDRCSCTLGCRNQEVGSDCRGNRGYQHLPLSVAIPHGDRQPDDGDQQIPRVERVAQAVSWGWSQRGVTAPGPGVWQPRGPGAVDRAERRRRGVAWRCASPCALTAMSNSHTDPIGGGEQQSVRGDEGYTRRGGARTVYRSTLTSTVDAWGIVGAILAATTLGEWTWDELAGAVDALSVDPAVTGAGAFARLGLA